MKIKLLTGICTALVFGGVNGPVFSAPGDTWTFSNCAKEGSSGPTQGDCDTEYTATSLDGKVTVANGIQSWVVPATGIYRIRALGAAGGTQTFGGVASTGGLGASISGDVNLVGGETLFFLVGQKGEDTRVSTANNAAPGGGGGAFVYRAASDVSPLMAAGGGGGGSSCAAIPNPALRHASTTTNGNDSASGPNGGSLGNGGRSNQFDDISYWPGGGAGWLTDGTGGNNPVDYDYTGGSDGALGGRAPQNGALGGTRWDDGNDEGGDGGFGGGGGGGSDNMGTGGGGGYSGGGGGGGVLLSSCNNSPGGGGGSYNSGSTPVNTVAVNAGHGQVIVTEIMAGEVQAVPIMSVWGLGILASMLGIIGFRRRMK